MSDLGDAFTRMPPDQQHMKGMEALKRANGSGSQQDDMTRRLLMLMQMQEAAGISDAVPRVRDLPVDYQPSERFNYGQPVRLG
jgi:hypothetical protein